MIISRATFYFTYTGFSAVFPPMASRQASKTKLPFFGELPAVVHSFVVGLLAEPHTMVRTLTVWKFRILPRYAYRGALGDLRINSVSHFHRFDSESDLVFKPVSKSFDCFSSFAFVQAAAVIL